MIIVLLLKYIKYKTFYFVVALCYNTDITNLYDQQMVTENISQLCHFCIIKVYIIRQ